MSLRKRTLTASILLCALFFVIQFAPLIVFFLLLQVFILAALVEFYNLADRRRLLPQRALGAACALIISASFYFPRLGFEKGLLICLLVTCTYFVVRTSTLERLASLPQSISVTFFGALYLSFTLNHLYRIRLEDGIYSIYFLFAVVFLGDTGAYFIGKPFGRKKMTPIASPNKTWEGSAGGILFACLGALAARELLLPDIVLWKAVLCGVLVHAAAQISDPFESLFKRAAGIKDSSSVLPGHGGFLDRIDSLILASPLFYYLVKALWK
jgi:phosphatidate cytidylyltransferase